MEIVSLVIAFGSLALALYTYFKHDKELKAQQKFINTFEIEKIKRENEELNKADVRAYMTHRHCGSYSGTLVIKNQGKAPAYNINIHYLPHKIYRDLSDHEIHELLPEAQQEYPIRLGFGTINISVRLTWSDASGDRECICRLF